ncbi:MAG: hypothetical protein EOQ93_02995 [Mesorhizobium sp.]|nr:MAG: hypothetical protein EOQ93_02995 [Mesorhizobium sp.]
MYSKPAGIDASPNTTIESADWNAFTADVEQDLNTARPVVAGGTGSGTSVGGNDNLSKVGADMASASTLNLANATGTLVTVTGTTTITALGTVVAGAERELIFAGALTLTHNATSLILPGGANITTAAGDVARFRSLGGGNWRCMSYQRGNGAAIAVAPNTTVATPTLTLKQSAAPTPTAEGDIQWDSDDDRLVVGDGAAQAVFSKNPATTVDNTVPRHDGTKGATQTSGVTIDDSNKLTAPGGLATSAGDLPFTKVFESAQQTITSGGTLTIAHGLGVSPPLVIAVLKCVTADAGWSIGNEITINIGKHDGSPERGFGVRQDATNLYVVYATSSNVMEYKDGVSGANAALTNSSWRLVLRAWA